MSFLDIIPFSQIRKNIYLGLFLSHLSVFVSAAFVCEHFLFEEISLPELSTNFLLTCQWDFTLTTSVSIGAVSNSKYGDVTTKFVYFFPSKTNDTGKTSIKGTMWYFNFVNMLKIKEVIK